MFLPSCDPFISIIFLYNLILFDIFIISIDIWFVLNSNIFGYEVMRSYPPISPVWGVSTQIVHSCRYTGPLLPWGI